MFNWRDLDELALEVVKASKEIYSQRTAVLFSLIMLIVFSVTGFLLAGVWTNRDIISLKSIEILFRDDEPLTVYEWSRVSPLKFPEFYVCDRNKCAVDIHKREQVLDVLAIVREEVHAIRATFVVFDGDLRRIVAQVSGPGIAELGEELWAVSTGNVGYNRRLMLLERGVCANTVLTDYGSDSMISTAGVKYRTAQIVSCPVDNSYLRGYLAVDYPVEKQEWQTFAQRLSAHATKIEEIMGYHG
jgi:hypothetical protein